MPHSELEHEPLTFGAMLDNYGTVVGPTEVRLEAILRTISMPSDARTANGFIAIGKLKDRLQKQYEAAYPALADIISHVIDQEEANARNVSPLFPHLVLPGLVEIHMSRVGLELPLKQPVFRSPPFSHCRTEANSAVWTIFAKG